MTSLDDETQVRGKRTAVSGTRSLLIGVGRGHVVGELSGAHEHLAVVVRAVLVLDLLGERLDLVDGVGDTDEIAPGNAVEGVAGGAHLAVHLVSSPDAIVGADTDGTDQTRRRGDVTEGRYLAWSKESSRPACDQG